MPSKPENSDSTARPEVSPLRELRQDWNALGRLDPMWAVLTDPRGKHGAWDIDEFFESGFLQVQALLRTTEYLGYPRNRGAALDFGCGVGRVTRALSFSFSECYGVDIAASMIAKGQELNAHVANCHFLVNAQPDLSLFESNHFDLVFSNIVLQHVPDKDVIKNYIAEFMRVLRHEGLLVFQLPSHMSWRNRIAARRRLYHLLRRLGVDERTLYSRLNLHPMMMNWIPEPEVTGLLKDLGATVLQIDHGEEAGAKNESRTYYATRR